MRIFVLLFLSISVSKYCTAGFFGSALSGIYMGENNYTVTLVQYWSTADSLINDVAYGALFEKGCAHSVKNIEMYLDTQFVDVERHPLVCVADKNIEYKVCVYKAKFFVSGGKDFLFVWQSKNILIRDIDNIGNELVEYSQILPLSSVVGPEDVIEAILPAFHFCSHAQNTIKMFDALSVVDYSILPVFSIKAQNVERQFIVPQASGSDDPFKKYPVDAPPYEIISFKKGYEKSLLFETGDKYTTDQTGVVEIECQRQGRFFFHILGDVVVQSTIKNSFDLVLIMDVL